MTRGAIVTGSDTGVGKSLVAALLLAAGREAAPGARRRYWKPVQTGTPPDDDSALVARAAGLVAEEVLPGAVRLRMPASPYEAARAEGVRPEPPWVLPPVPEDALLVVEGAGGLLVPFDEGTTNADLFAAWGLPLVVVARPEVGTLNHTLLTLEAARRRGLGILAVVVSRPPTAAVAEILRVQGGVPVVVVPEIPDPERDVRGVAAALARDPGFSRLLDEILAPQAAQASDLVARDRVAVWHPYTQHGLGEDPLPVASARGAWLTLADGRRVLDGFSSWWTCLHGHGHPRIAAAIAEQARRLDHVGFGGATHEPAVRLAERLREVAPPGLARVFYSDDGSTAVEAALKMALAWHVRRGAFQRRKFVALAEAYHGDTSGAMSVSAQGPFTRDFGALTVEVLRTPAPVRGRGPAEALEALGRLLAAEADGVAAMIVEPLLLGASGMLPYDAAWLRQARELAREHGVLFIADEVFTGFGRTGARFACERADVAPDLLCLSKAITGGALPLAATLATESIYEAFLSPRTADAFLHGHSYTANPIACAAALASLDLLDAAALARAEAIGRRLERGLAPLEDDPRVREIRGLGPLRAVEVVCEGPGYLATAGRRMAAAALAQGVWLRPLGNVIYALPPLCVTDSEVDLVAAALRAAVAAGTTQAGRVIGT